MGEWTKGPWAAGRDHEVYSVAEYSSVAMVLAVRDVGKANANLIAAAPDLAEALECCLGLLTGNMDGNWDLGDPVDMARAALKKAKGEA